MNAQTLAAALQSPQPPLLLHVLPAEHFVARRIAGAMNACVYEVAFVEQVRALAPDPAQPIVVYGEGEPSQDSAEAASQLQRAGYTAVTDFRGGLREWDAAGRPLESDAALPEPPHLTGIYRVDPAASVVRWTGRNLFNHHAGHVRLGAGEVELTDGALSRAGFTIDLGTIVCEDLRDPAVHAMLIRHLRSGDFFDVENHPTARFETTRLEPIEASSEGTPNFRVTGAFTLRGITQEITFPAVIAAADTDHITAQAQLEIDRTRWGSRYGSGKFFAFLGKHVVNDHIAIHLKIQAVRA
jgi:polyisoprenoid-binding protein YceI